MHQPVLVQVGQGIRQGEADLQTLLNRQTLMLRHLAGERSGRVALGVNFLAPHLIVGQFHHVIETILVPSDVENIHLAVVGAGDRLELLDAVEFPFERAVVLEGVAINDFGRPVRAHHVAGQPDFAIAPAANAAD